MILAPEHFILNIHARESKVALFWEFRLSATSRDKAFPSVISDAAPTKCSDPCKRLEKLIATSKAILGGVANRALNFLYAANDASAHAERSSVACDMITRFSAAVVR